MCEGSSKESIRKGVTKVYLSYKIQMPAVVCVLDALPKLAVTRLAMKLACDRMIKAS